MKHLLLLIVICLLISCGSDKRSNYTTVDENGKKIMTEESIQIMEDLLEDFKNCRSTSKNGLLDCKFHIARALCEFYQIDDFRNNGEYVDYHEMHDIILGKFGTWKLVGDATDQKALNKAQEFANNGNATVAISTSESYGHVAIVLPGECEKAPSWGGLKVPNCASFFMVQSLEPFIGKSLAYAWSDNSPVKLYAKIED